jgi:Rrf2 family protein
MNLSQRCQYALRALFELATRRGEGPIPTGEIAEAQAIPPRFLELILAQLKQAGYVESQRGAKGGYQLAVSPDALTVGEVIRFVEGPLGPVQCLAGADQADCPLLGQCVFLGLWERAHEAVSRVYDTTSLQDLIDQAGAAEDRYVGSYCI